VADTDTTAHAHVLLPAMTWGEKDGTVTNSERCISRQRAFLPAPGESKPDWWMFCEVAKRMGFKEGFNFKSPHEIFIEHAQLSAAGNDGKRAFNIGAMAELSREDYDNLPPTRWPQPHVASAMGQIPGSPADPAHDRAPEIFADGRFYHPDGRARFIATVPRSPNYLTDTEYPLILNTGRIRDQWHTMTRTGRSARLMAHAPEPFVDMHAQDALLAGVRAGELVQVTSRWGSLIARLRTSGEIARRMIFVPMHWNSQFAGNARVGALINPAVDPISGEPEFKHTPARVAPFIVAWQGFALSRKPLLIRDATAWSLTPSADCLRYELAGRRVFGNWTPWARRMFDADAPNTDWLEYVDQSTGVFRAAYVIDDRIEACVFLSPRPDLPPRLWLASLFAKSTLETLDRTALLTGRPPAAGIDPGDIVCSCFGVGRNSINAGIRQRGLTTALQIGQHLRAGTNCGSCLPELNAILKVERAGILANES
jgi:assimilatory nitrate reductase catalytic subunit